MRRFRALGDEVDFVDGDEASDEAVQNYQKHLKETVQNAAQGISPTQSKTPTSKASRSQKLKLSSSNPLNHAEQARPTHDARQHAPERRPRRHRLMRGLRPLGRHPRRSPARNYARARGWPLPRPQQMQTASASRPDPHGPGTPHFDANGRRCHEPERENAIPHQWDRSQDTGEPAAGNRRTVFMHSGLRADLAVRLLAFTHRGNV